MRGGWTGMTRVSRSPGIRYESVEHELQRFWVGPAFEVKDPLCERLWGVIREDGAAFLEDDRTVVELGVDDVDGASALTVASLKGGAMHAAAEAPGPTVSWKEGGVDVDDAPLKAGRNVDVAEIAAENDEIDAMGAEVGAERLGLEFALDQIDGNAAGFEASDAVARL